MGLFGGNKETKEDKEQRKQQEILTKYRLNELSDPADIESVRQIIYGMAGFGFQEAGMLLGAASEKDVLRMQLQLQKAIFEQNFIMIRQLDRICKALNKE